MASQYDININIDVESANLGQLEKELTRLNEQIRAVPRNTADFNKAAANIKKVTTEVNNANAQLQKVDVGKTVGNFAKVGAAIGAAGLVFQQFGEEGSATNEALQKTLERTQAILGLVAVAEGVVAAAELATAAALKIKTVAQNLANKAVNSGVVSLKGLKVALISTGIGAFVVALGLVIANFDKIKEFFTGGSTAKYEKELESLEKAEKRYASDLEQKIAFSERLLAAGEDEIENINYRIAVQEEYAQKSEAANKRVLQTLTDLKVENGFLTSDQIEQQNKIFAAGEKNQKAIIDLQKRKNEIILKDSESAANKEIAIAKAKGQDTYELEEKALKDRLSLLKQFGDAYKKEVEQTENELAVLQAAEQKKRNDAAKAAAQKRRDQVKSELNEISQIIATDPVEALRLLNAEQARAEAILLKYSKGSKDVTTIIKELNKEGLTPLAEQFGRLTNKSNYEDFTKLLKTYYGDQATSIIKSVTDEFSATVGEIESVGAKTAEGFFTGFGREVTREIVKTERPGGGIAESIALTSKFKDLPIVLKQIKEFTQATVNEIKKATEESTAEIDRLVNAGVITAAQGEEEKVKITKASQAAIIQANIEKDAAVSRELQKAVDYQNTILQGQINDVEKALKQLEQKYSGSNFSTILGDEVRDTIDLQIQLINKQRQGLEKRREDLENSKKLNIINEEEYAAAVLDIDKQLAESQIALDGLVGDKRKQTLKEIAAVYNEIINLTNAVMANQQAATDLDVANIDKTIAAEEAQLAKSLQNKKLTEEQRAELEEQADYRIAVQKNKQTKLIAENQKKQAESSFALSVADIVIQGALASIKAFAQLGPIGGFIASGLIAVTTGVSISAANNAKNAAIAQADAALAGIVEPQPPGGGSLDGGGRTQFASGGYVSGPGTSTSDSISARLSNGEYVVNAAATQAFLPMLEQINNTGLSMQNGGLASGPNIIDVLTKIEKRLATAPKAYVVSTEIQTALDTQEYLERRSQLT